MVRNSGTFSNLAYSRTIPLYNWPFPSSREVRRVSSFSHLGSPERVKNGRRSLHLLCLSNRALSRWWHERSTHISDWVSLERRRLVGSSGTRLTLLIPKTTPNSSQRWHRRPRDSPHTVIDHPQRIKKKWVGRKNKWSWRFLAWYLFSYLYL